MKAEICTRKTNRHTIPYNEPRQLDISLILSCRRLWKYEAETIRKSEFLLDSLLYETLEFDNDIFAAGELFSYFPVHFHIKRLE